MPLTTGTALTFRQHPAHRVLYLLSCIRLGEVLVLQGSPLLGALFATGHLTIARGAEIGLLVAGSTLLIAHVFVLNDWSGMSYDARDPNRRNGIFTTRGIARNGVGYLSLALVVAALVLLSRFRLSTLTIAVAIAGLSAMYSFPRVHLKGVPVLSSALHFAGGLLHFLLGYSLFTAPDWRGIQIGSFFALVFVAGHLTHETRDSDSDRVNDIRTNAVTFGKMRSFIGGLILFTMADILLVVLALRSVVPRPLAIVVFIVPLHAYWSRAAIQSGLTFASIQRLQARYRALYAGMGLWMVATLLAVR
ncbi:MAG TPA: UbiA family prenyltransferase [Bryobacteraceae bacterium]|nr:UbiA family prenyltransferase [Bryobacteraceae bacterium]